MDRNDDVLDRNDEQLQQVLAVARRMCEDRLRGPWKAFYRLWRMSTRGGTAAIQTPTGEYYPTLEAGESWRALFRNWKWVNCAEQRDRQFRGNSDFPKEMRRKRIMIARARRLRDQGLRGTGT